MHINVLSSRIYTGFRSNSPCKLRVMGLNLVFYHHSDETSYPCRSRLRMSFTIGTGVKPESNHRTNRFNFADTKSFLNGFPPHPYTMGHLPFMQLNHPLIPPPVTLAMAQQLGLRHDGMMGRDPTHLGSERLSSRYFDNNYCALLLLLLQLLQ